MMYTTLGDVAEFVTKFETDTGQYDLYSQVALAKKWNIKIRNDLHTLEEILYDMDHLTVARGIFQKAWKFKPPTIPTKN